MHTFRAYIFTFVSSEASCFSDFMYLADLGLLSPLVCVRYNLVCVFNRAEDRMFQALERLVGKLGSTECIKCCGNLDRA